MAAANASACGQRTAILSSLLSELAGFSLTSDCLRPGCARERTFAVADLATFRGRRAAPDEVFWRLWRPCGLDVAGDGACVERPRQTAPGGAGSSIYRTSTGETIGSRLLEIIVYDKCCRIGATLSLEDSVIGKCPTLRRPVRTRRLRVG